MGKTAEALTYLNLIFKHNNIMTTTIYLGITQQEIQGIYEMIELD
jgi:site-specific recombinase XerD